MCSQSKSYLKKQMQLNLQENSSTYTLNVLSSGRFRSYDYGNVYVVTIKTVSAITKKK